MELAGSSENEPAWPSDASPSSRRGVRFENVEEGSESDVYRDKVLSPTKSDQQDVYLKALRDLSSEKQKRKRKEKNMLKLAQELGNRTAQVADKEKQLEALRSEISVLKKKFFDTNNAENEERDESGSAGSLQETTSVQALSVSSQTQVERLENELSEKIQESRTLEEKLADRSKTLELLRREYLTKNEELRFTEAELKRERANVTQLTEHISNLETECANHIQEKEDALSRISSLEIELVAKDKLLLKQCETSGSENKLLNQEREAEIKELRQTLSFTQESLKKLGEDAATHEQVLHGLNAEKIQKEESIRLLENELAKEKAEIERLTTLNNKLEEEKTTTQNKLEVAAGDILSLKASLLEKENLLLESNTKHLLHESELANLRDEIQRKEAEFKIALQKNAESLRLLHEECKDKDAKLDSMKAELVRESSTLRAAEDLRCSVEAECKALRTEKDEVLQLIEALRSEIANLKSTSTVTAPSSEKVQSSVNSHANEQLHESLHVDESIGITGLRQQLQQKAKAVEALQTALTDCTKALEAMKMKEQEKSQQLRNSKKESLQEVSKSSTKEEVPSKEFRVGLDSLREKMDAKERICIEQESRIESLKNAGEGLLEDCKILRESLRKLAEENRSLFLKFDFDKKAFADIDSRIRTQQKEANAVKEELLRCRDEIQRLVDQGKECGDGVARVEHLITTKTKHVSDMLSNLECISRTMENFSSLKCIVEGLKHDLNKRDARIAELQKDLHLLALNDLTVLKGDESSDNVSIDKEKLELDVLKDESRRSLETAAKALNLEISKLTRSKPSSDKINIAIDQLQASCNDNISRIITHLETEVAQKLRMKAARDKAMQALSQYNLNMEETSKRMKDNLENLSRQHAEKIESLQGQLSNEIQTKDQTIRDHEAALRVVENKATSKFAKLRNKNEEMLMDFESQIQDRIDKLDSKLEKKAARVRLLQKLLTHQLQTQTRRGNSRLLRFTVLFAIFIAPVLVHFCTVERQWFCGSTPPWEPYRTTVQVETPPSHPWWKLNNSFNVESTPPHPWWKWNNNSYLDWLEVKLCKSQDRFDEKSTIDNK